MKNATAPEIVLVDPGTLIIGANVRVDRRADKEFTASIRERGVTQAITAYRNEDDALVVITGQRRTLAAVEVGLAAVRVIIEAQPVEVDRIIDQMGENEHRSPMTEAERLAGIEQLSLTGLSAAQIAKRTATKRTRVDAALTVASSPTARELLQTNPLTLEQGAVLAEFDADPEATSRLLDAADTHRFDHVAQRLRDDATEAAALKVEQAKWTAQGHTVIDNPGYGSPVKRLGNLVDADGIAFDPEEYPSVPGAALYLTQEWTHANHDDQDEDEDGAEGESICEWVPMWVCPSPATHGYKDKYGYADSAGHKLKQSPEQSEAVKAERRLVIENNKAWRSAVAVRREWLRLFAARRTAPKGAEALIVQAMLEGPHFVQQAQSQRQPLLREWLGVVETAGGWNAGSAALQVLADAATADTAKRQVMVALLAVLAGWEKSTDVHTWRHCGAWDTRIMTALIEWGYQPSEVEMLLVVEADK